VVWRQWRSTDPALSRAAVGRDARRRRDQAQRGARSARGRVQRDPAVPRSARAFHSGYWDPFFAACAETSTVLCLHIGSGTKMPADFERRAARL
jgi:hypothetical protein